MLITNHQMTESELMAEARRSLHRRLLEAPAIRDALTAPEPPPRHYTPEHVNQRGSTTRDQRPMTTHNNG